MGNRREMEIAGKNLVIYEHDLDRDALTSDKLAGCWLWDCAIILAHYLPTNGQSLPGKRVIELGSGTGLPGLVAASLGAYVTLTDLPHLLPGLQRNVDANSNAISSGTVQVRPLAWGDDCSDFGPPFDIVLMSDLLYDALAMPALCQTLKGLSDRHTQILLAYELRFGTTDCFRVLRECGFRWIKVGKEELHPVWQSEDIGVFRVSYLQEQ